MINKSFIKTVQKGVLKYKEKIRDISTVGELRKPAEIRAQHTSDVDLSIPLLADPRYRDLFSAHFAGTKTTTWTPQTHHVNTAILTRRYKTEYTVFIMQTMHFK